MAFTERGEVLIDQRGPLLDEVGHLTMPGFAFTPLLNYDRSQIKASKLRIKEWDYYLVNDDEYALAFTIGDLGYIALVSASLMDYRNASYKTTSTLGIMPLGRLHMPEVSDYGVSTYADKKANMTFSVADGKRLLEVDFRDFDNGDDLHVEVFLDEEPRDSMVIATPWKEDEHAFYYNRKIVGMRAQGSFTRGTLHHVFDPKNSFGLLDWGRGVWTRDNTWFWGVAQGMQDGGTQTEHRFAMNLGYGFGDTSRASENMVFVDGIAHKLGRVDFGVPVRPGADPKGHVSDIYDLMSPWHMTDDEDRLDLTFEPLIDRTGFLDFKLVRSDQHQVFGTLEGHVVLDDGTRFAVHELKASAEVIHNVY